MSMLTPVESLAEVVKKAEEREAIGHMVGRLKLWEELELETIKRLVRERDYIVGIIDRELKGRSNRYKKDGNDCYKDNLVEALEGVLADKGR